MLFAAGRGLLLAFAVAFVAGAVALFAGSNNKCFLAASQQRTFAYFDALSHGRHRLQLLRGYTHLDAFLGREAHRDVFPLIVESLD